VSITVRPGTIDDVPQAHAINIHYVLNTVITFQQTPSLLAEFEAKFRSITARGLPFLVAVERPASSSSDIVIGYAHLTPFRGTKLSYAPSVELSIYLHHSHTGKGTGSLLLAALLAAASSPEGGGIIHCAIENSNYSTSSHHERSADEPYGYPIRNIIACMALDPEGKDTGEWLC
jgi:L-amino acid N-acyltransferase YncA